MSRTIRIAVVVVGSGLIGAAVGYATCSYFDSRLGATFAWASYQDRATILRFDVEALQALRRGEVSSVIDAIETRVDTGLASVSSYHDYVPISLRSPSFYDDVEAARAYRSTHPGPLSDGPIGDAVRKALALRPQDASR
jgi:hypothetical protein